MCLCSQHAGQTDTRIEHHCSASVGVLVFTGTQKSQAEILQGADAAMCQAKEAGRNRVQLAAASSLQN